VAKQVLSDFEVATRKGTLEYLRRLLKEAVVDGSLMARWKARTTSFNALNSRLCDRPGRNPTLRMNDHGILSGRGIYLYKFGINENWKLYDPVDDKAELISRLVRSRLDDGFSIYGAEGVATKSLKALFAALNATQVWGLRRYIKAIKFVFNIMGSVTTRGEATVLYCPEIPTGPGIFFLIRGRKNVVASFGVGGPYIIVAGQAFDLADEVSIRQAILKRLKGVKP